MINQLIRYLLRFLLVILFQVLILNNIQLSGYINPYFYIWYILVLPFETPGWLLLVTAFFLGLGIDVFPQGIAGNGSTIGTHAAATVLIAFMRQNVLRWTSRRDDYSPGNYPDSKSYGFLWFLSYAVIMVGIHHFALFFLEDLSITDLPLTLIRVILSGAFSLIIMLLWEGIRFRISR